MTTTYQPEGFQTFQVMALPETLSGHKVHVYSENAEQVQMIWSRIKQDVELDGLGCKLATNRFFDLVSQPEHSHQHGKGVTVYFPNRATWEDQMNWLVRVLEGLPFCGKIDGDDYIGNGVNYRFEFHHDPGFDVPVAEIHDWYQPAR